MAIDNKVKAAFGELVLGGLMKDTQIENLVEEVNKLKAENDDLHKTIENLRMPKLVEKEKA